MRRLSKWLLAATCLLGACAAGRSDRPAVDAEAMREAMGGGAVTPYASSRAYGHYLKAKLAEQAGDTGAALEELRLALVYDDESAELHVALGWIYARLNRLELADEACRRALEMDPEHHEAHLLLGKLAAVQRHKTAALHHLERAIELRPESPEAYLVLVRYLANAGEFAHGERVAARLAKIDPAEGEAYRLLARSSIEARDVTRARGYLRAAAKLDGQDVASLLLLARLEEERGRLADAQAAYLEALAREPDHAEALLGAAGIALRRADPSGAQAYFGKLLATSSDAAEARLRVAQAYLAAHRHAEALAVLEEAQAGAPEDFRILYQRALVHEGQRAYPAAVAAYREIPKSSGDLYLVARARLANCLSLAGDQAQALAAIDDALALAVAHPGSEASTLAFGFIPDIYRRFGRSAEGVARLETLAASDDRTELLLSFSRALLDVGRHHEAILRLASALERDPGDERLIFALATARDRSGDVEGAVGLMRRILRDDPQHASALNFIGYAYAERDMRLDEARALLLEALRLRPDEGYFLDSLGWCELKRGDVRAAVEQLEKADALAPGEAVIVHHLAEAYARAGRRGEAVATWSRALELLDRDPDPHVRRKVEERLRENRVGAVRR